MSEEERCSSTRLWGEREGSRGPAPCARNAQIGMLGHTDGPIMTLHVSPALSTLPAEHFVSRRVVELKINASILSIIAQELGCFFTRFRSPP
jgi:hypothetical protein